VNTYQTLFYWERGFAWLRGAYGADWPDWMGLALDWQGGPQREGQRLLLESITLSDDGYVYTWNPPGSESWPFPGPPYDSRHFTSNAQYVLGIAHYFAWTGKHDFLAKMLPRARAAIRYYLERLGGSKGLVTIDQGLIAGTSQLTHTGEDGSPGTNYWDLISYGWLDAYVNAYYYGALLAAADLEDVAGHQAESARLRRLARRARRQYNEKFFVTFALPDGTTGGRYVGNIDDLGTAHYQGSTYLNLEAMRFGLPEREQGLQILAWLDRGSLELTSNLVLLNPGNGSLTVAPGSSAAESFSVQQPMGSVAAFVTTGGDLSTAMTLSLFAGSEPVGTPIATRRCSTVYNGWWANVDLAEPAPAGEYCLQISEVSGTLQWAGGPAQSGVTPSLNGQVINNPAGLALVAVSAYEPSSGTVYSKYTWVPLTTARKNNFHYIWLWKGVTVPFGQQLEDGGADLYVAGFDIIARARYAGPDDAFVRTQALLERFSQPDHLCGGAPLYEGEQPENEVSAWAVGVDVPFPESAVAPASFLYAYFGVEARPQGLRLRPALPSGVEWIEVDNISYRGSTLDIRVDQQHVTVTLDVAVERYQYVPGSSIEVGRQAGNAS